MFPTIRNGGNGFVHSGSCCAAIRAPIAVTSPANTNANCFRMGKSVLANAASACRQRVDPEDGISALLRHGNQSARTRTDGGHPRPRFCGNLPGSGSFETQRDRLTIEVGGDPADAVVIGTSQPPLDGRPGVRLA